MHITCQGWFCPSLTTLQLVSTLSPVSAFTKVQGSSNACTNFNITTTYNKDKADHITQVKLMKKFGSNCEWVFHQIYLCIIKASFITIDAILMKYFYQKFRVLKWLVMNHVWKDLWSKLVKSFLLILLSQLQTKKN